MINVEYLEKVAEVIRRPNYNMPLKTKEDYMKFDIDKIIAENSGYTETPLATEEAKAYLRHSKRPKTPLYKKIPGYIGTAGSYLGGAYLGKKYTNSLLGGLGGSIASGIIYNKTLGKLLTPSQSSEQKAWDEEDTKLYTQLEKQEAKEYNTIMNRISDPKYNKEIYSLYSKVPNRIPNNINSTNATYTYDLPKEDSHKVWNWIANNRK